MKAQYIAAIDLGSNSFRLQIGRLEGKRIYYLDSLKEPVRLASGLSERKILDEAAQDRALIALKKFGERIRDFDVSSVRAVATNTLRIAKNASELLRRAEAILGFPIEVISGVEEARLIYMGAAHELPDITKKQLVIDIGGGSTECIIGQEFDPILLESLYMGCVSWSMKYFVDGVLNEQNMQMAENAALKIMSPILQTYKVQGWENVVATSGTAKVLTEICRCNGLSDGRLTLDAIKNLRKRLLDIGSINALDQHLKGARKDRFPVLAGGFAIMSALFQGFGIETLEFCDGALRQGVLYDIMARKYKSDLRNVTVEYFMNRFNVSHEQAHRVAQTASRLFYCIHPRKNKDDKYQELRRIVYWSSLLHEIGIFIAHPGFHRHSAYIVENADMPGFSRQEQIMMAILLRAQRGKLSKVTEADWAQIDELAVLCIRLAVVLHRSRSLFDTPHLVLQKQDGNYLLNINTAWIERNQLTMDSLLDEQKMWEEHSVKLLIHET